MKKVYKYFIVLSIILTFAIPSKSWARHLLETEAQIKDLREQINNHDYSYFINNHSKISDSEYDLLFEKLQNLENKYPQFIASNSPTQKVGHNVSSDFKKVEHSTKLYSLGKVYSEQQLTQWYNKVLENFPKQNVDFVCELKIDGLAVALIYKNGEFVQGSTRGNGSVGEDVTENLKTIKSLPLKLPNTADLQVRGEVFMPKASFDKLQDAKHIRNSASGALRQLDPQITTERNLDFFAYKIENNAKNQYETLKILQENGFKVNPNVKLCKNLNEIKDFINYWKNNHDKLDYAIDGIVIKVNDYSKQEKLGYTAKHPKWAIAYKYSEEKHATQITNIEMTVGRTGKITPVAIIKPVEIDGALISKASLGSINAAEKLDLRKGDTVLVERAGGVIPKIVSIDVSKRPANATKFDYKSSQNEKSLLKQKLNHWANRNCMDITGLGKSLIAELVDKNMVKDYSDLYKLTEKDLLKLDGIKNKKAQKIITSIQKSKQMPVSNLIYALGINGIGQDTAVILGNKFKSLKELSNTDKKELNTVSGIGNITAENIADYFKNSENINMLKNLQKYGVRGIELN
jgi:DNA ligase (NAD+)